MPDSKRNQNSNKRSEEEIRKRKPKIRIRNCPDDKNNSAESISTADDTANEKYARTVKRK